MVGLAALQEATAAVARLAAGFQQAAAVAIPRLAAHLRLVEGGPRLAQASAPMYA